LGHLVDDPSLPIDPDIRARTQLGRDISLRDYLTTLAEREGHQHAFAAATADVDAILTPTTQTPALPVAQSASGPRQNHFLRIGNYLGLCALAVPNGFTVDGLPTSLQILCPGGSEAMALRIGWAYEQATAWRERHPPEA
jgi:aspartyl-tRNA(Asn)/glutamyl-tRNA(Gln) amidotransferase subunit A